MVPRFSLLLFAVCSSLAPAALPRPRRRTCTPSCCARTSRRTRPGRTRGRPPSPGIPSRGAIALRVPALHRAARSRRTRSSGRTRHLTDPAHHDPAHAPLDRPARRTPSTRACARALPATTRPAGAQRYGFRMRSPAAPASLSNGAQPEPGHGPLDAGRGRDRLRGHVPLRPGPRAKKKIKTATTAADLREYYTFHNDMSPRGLGDVALARPRGARARGRDRRTTFRPSPTAPGAPRTSDDGRRRSFGAIVTRSSADLPQPGRRHRRASSAAPAPTPHELFPGFWWSGRYEPRRPRRLPRRCRRRRRHVPALPRLRLHGRGLREPRPRLRPRRQPGLRAAADAARSKLPGRSGSGSPRRAGPLPRATPAARRATSTTPAARSVFAGRPRTEPPARPGRRRPPGGREARPEAPASGTTTGPTAATTGRSSPSIPCITPDRKVEYHDVEFAEDMCAAGRVDPVRQDERSRDREGERRPVRLGHDRLRRRSAARRTTAPAFFGRVVVAWRPAPGAAKYQVQWSRKAEPVHGGRQRHDAVDGGAPQPARRRLALPRPRHRQDAPDARAAA